MGVRHYLDLLEAEPEVYTKERIVVIHLDEVKRSTAVINSPEFLLPQWQYEELGMEDDIDDDECD